MAKGGNKNQDRKSRNRSNISSSLILPPQNLDAEQSLLGAILADKNAIIKIIDVVTADDFYDGRHTIIFEAMLELFNKNRPIDLVTLSEVLESEKNLGQIGGSGYLAEIAGSTSSATNIIHYGQIIRDKAILRRLIEASAKIGDLGHNEEQDITDTLDQAEQSLFAVSQKFLKDKFVPVKDILTEAFNRIDKIHRDKEKGALRGVSSGFKDLDAITAGFQKSDLIIIAARPSMGKTSFALNLAEHAAIEEKLPIGVFSLEMSKEQLIDRLLASQAGVDSWKLRTGNLSDDDFPRIGYAMGVLSEASLFIDDSPGANIMEIRAKARRLQMEHGLGLVILDYLQLMEGRSRSGDMNRVQEISEISRSLKGLARELDVPVIALSQLSRAVEHRDDKRPQLSDLRESGCLSGDTMIYNAKNGCQIPIKELVGKEDFVCLSMDQDGNINNKRMSKCFSTGTKKVYELTLENDKKIKATTNHKFFTKNGWQRLDAISNKDRLAVLPILDQNNLEIEWNKVLTIKGLGLEEVYDMTVPKTHNFIANDIIVHNSIEQDADVVMFLYRDDYYDRDSDKKGVTEILIKKHRNGPTGMCELFFQPEQMRFRDLEKKRAGDVGPEDLEPVD